MVIGVVFITGLISSLHCVGMCGPLVTSSCHKPKDIYTYQWGRLVGYIVIGLLAISIGLQFRFIFEENITRVILNIILSGIFLAWGLTIYRNKSIFNSKIIQYLNKNTWKKVYQLRSDKIRSFGIGLFSPILPCGIFYGVLLALLVSQKPIIILLGIFFFWLGTVPSLTFSPIIINKVISPLHKKYPKQIALTFISFGLLAINYRTIINGVIYVCH